MSQSGENNKDNKNTTDECDNNELEILKQNNSSEMKKQNGMTVEDSRAIAIPTLTLIRGSLLQIHSTSHLVQQLSGLISPPSPSHRPAPYNPQTRVSSE